MNARFQSNGVDTLLDAIAARRDAVAGLRERMWAVVWARGYPDLLTTLPGPSDFRGHVVYARPFLSGYGLLLLDTGDHLIGFYDRLEPVPVGSRAHVFLSLEGGSPHWMLNASAVVGCGLAVHFDGPRTALRPAGATWIERLRKCLEAVRDGEAAARKQIEQERAAVPFRAEPAPLRAELEEADKALRERVLQSSYTDEEKRQLATIKTADAMKAFAAARNKRLHEFYHAEAAKFREERLPELRAEYERRCAEYAAFRHTIEHFNELDAQSRSIVEESLLPSRQLHALEQAELNVEMVALEAVEANPRAHFGELVTTIELLFELMPRHLQHVAHVG